MFKQSPYKPGQLRHYRPPIEWPLPPVVGHRKDNIGEVGSHAVTDLDAPRKEKIILPFNNMFTHSTNDCNHALVVVESELSHFTHSSRAHH